MPLPKSPEKKQVNVVEKQTQTNQKKHLQQDKKEDQQVQLKKK
jgi:hypothetical protein